MTTPLITLDNAKGILNIRGTNTDYDAIIQLLAETATQQIEDEIGRALEQGLLTEWFNTRRSRRTVLDLYGQSDEGTTTVSSRQGFYLTGLFPDQAQSITVWYDPGFTFDDSTKLVEGNDYHIDWEDAYLTLFIGTVAATKSLKVEYTAGIPASGTPPTLEASAPADLRLACLYQTAYLFKRHREDNIGLNVDRGVLSDQSNVQGGEWNAAQGLCQEARSHVRKYRQVRMGRG